jgi:hypothetical protein
MAPKKDDGARYSLPHIRIEQFRRENPYSPPPRGMDPRVLKRDNVTHGRALERQFSAAYARARAAVGQRRALQGHRIPGVYLEVTSARNENLGDLSWERKGIRLGALRSEDDEVQKAVIFVPESSAAFVTERLQGYATQVEVGKSPSLVDRFESIENVSVGSAGSLWTDVRRMPEDPRQPLWWECWTWIDKVEELELAALRLELQVSVRRLVFPEVHVIPVYANTQQIETLAFGTGAIEQLRNATDSPSFFTLTVRREQNPWVDDFRARITAPRENSPAVCLLDTGVAQAHPLISLALSEADCLSVNTAWGTADDIRGHGTKMAGTILYDDLTYPLADQRTVELPFILESVKFIPPEGFEPTDPQSYGSITQSAVSLAEIHAPDRDRVFCMAVTNRDVSGERPTSWSAALDQAASGAMVGDREDLNKIGPRRLFLVAGGNIPDTSDPDEISDIDEYPVEDPAQAWNVITVGGFTQKTVIDPAEGYADWTAVAESGDRSPYSRISTDWEHSRTPIKPEIVFEAGNKAISPEQNEILSGLDSLSLLTTNSDFNNQNLATFWATSPATAQASGMAGAIAAKFQSFWPETIRALMIHSAEWTPPMFAQLAAARTKKEKIVLSRHFGYGVPSLNRALASAENDLVLLAQRELAPFQRVREIDQEGHSRLKPASFKQIDYYDLPWPVNTLEELGEKQVALKITLSYFIEPSPNWDASLAPQAYQSFGLRFDLKRAAETELKFHERINSLERDGSSRTAASQDEGWTFGIQSIAAGSVHCDVWRGPAANLAARGKIAIYPVGGWWRDRVRLKRHSAETRYSLAVSISSEEQDVRLYSEIANLVSISSSI